MKLKTISNNYISAWLTIIVVFVAFPSFAQIKLDAIETYIKYGIVRSQFDNHEYVGSEKFPRNYEYQDAFELALGVNYVIKTNRKQERILRIGVGFARRGFNLNYPISETIFQQGICCDGNIEDPLFSSIRENVKTTGYYVQLPLDFAQRFYRSRTINLYGNVGLISSLLIDYRQKTTYLDGDKRKTDFVGGFFPELANNNFISKIGITAEFVAGRRIYFAVQPYFSLFLSKFLEEQEIGRSKSLGIQISIRGR